MRTTSRMIAALALAVATTAAGAQTPPTGGEGGSGAAASPPATVPTPAAPPVAAPSAAPAAAAPAAPAPAAPTAGAPPHQGTPATVIDTQDYESLLGRSVRSAQGDELGRVIDVLVDKEGHPRAAIIDFGGFLGVGTRKIAVDWRALRFTSDGKERRLSVALTRNQVRVSPEYKSGEPIVVLGPASATTPAEGDQTAAAQPPAPASTPVPAPTPAPAPAPSTVAPAATPASPPAASAPQQAPDK